MGIYDGQPEDQPVVKAVFPKPKLLVNTGLDEWWAHCAVCEAVPEGHWGDGSIKWQGGVIYGTPQGEQNVYAYACRCAAGQQLHDTQHWSYFDTILNVMGAKWETQPRPVLGRAEKRPRMPSSENHEKLIASFSRQISRFIGGELSQKELHQNLEYLCDKVAPDRKPAPTLDDVLFTPELWAAYFPSVPYPDRLNPMAAHRLRKTAE